MRILRVIASMNPTSGGPCEGIRNSIPTMEKKGILNEVVSLDDPKAEFLKESAFKIYALGPGKGPYAYSKQLSRWLEHHLKDYEVVIIHGLWLHNSYGTFRVWKNLKRNNEKSPVLYVMPHGMLDPYFQRSKRRTLKAIRNWFFWKLVEEKVVNGADGLLFTCQEELLLARENFKPYHPKKEWNISYGIKKPPDSGHIAGEDFQLKLSFLDGRPYLLFLSRIHPKKGVDNLIRAYLKLKKEEDNLPDLVIAGPGLETNFGKKILNMVVGHNSIHFPGMLQGGLKWAAFYGCEAFILPSHQENFGIAVVEAMACEKPVLITKQINICQKIKAGEAGLISEDTEEGVSNLLRRWISLSKAEKLKMGRNAIQVFNSHYSIEKASENLIHFLRVDSGSNIYL